MRNFFVSLLGLLAFLPMTFAAYFTNVPQVRVQPNGDTLHCFATGDEYFHRLHDADGYTIVLDPATGYYVYADKVGDTLVPTEYVAGRTNPAEVGLVANLSISADQWRARRQRWEGPSRERAGMRDYEINHGHINSLVVFIRFADDDPFTNDFDDVRRMFNDDTQGSSSMYNYFWNASYGQLSITSTFYPPQSGSDILSYQDIYDRKYYEPYNDITNPDGYATDDDRTYREHMLLSRAVNAIAGMVPEDLDIDYDDDGFVDNIVFVVRGNVGNWNDLLWPHKWTLWTQEAYSYINGKQVWTFNFQLADATSYFNSAVLCHEMNHSLGAPDLYHYYEGTDLSPVGEWDLMHSTTYPPQHMGAYMKYKYGHWIDDIPELTECGSYSIRSLGSSATNNCYRIATPHPNEFFILEYRNRNDNFESALPGSGLLVYRINTSFSGNAGYDGITYFDEVYIYRPFGTPTENGSIYSAAFSANEDRTEMSENTNPQPFLTDGTVVGIGDFIIRDISYAGGDSMTFKLCESGYLNLSPAEVTIGADAGSTGSSLISSDMDWTIDGGCDWLSFTPAEGNGTVSVQLTVLSENSSFVSRSCELIVTATNGDQVTLTVVQRGREPYLEAEITDPVSGTTGILQHQNSTCNIEINSNAAWTISSNEDWVGFSQAEGEGSASIQAIALSENTICIPRYALLTVTNNYNQSVVLRVKQENFFNGSLSITPVELNIDNQMNATVSFTITATDSWSVQSLPSWLSANPSDGEFSDHLVTLTAIGINNSTLPRTGTVVVSDICGRTDSRVLISVTQPEGYLSLSETSVSVGQQNGSTATVNVSCSGGWNAVSSSIPEWLSVTPSSATGNTEVTLRATADNTEETERSAVVRFRYTLNFVEELLVTQECGSGIVEVAEVSMTLYPNPVNDLLTVETTGESQYTVYDAAGRPVLHGSLSSEQNAISMSRLESGVYFVRITDVKTGKVAAVKVVKS